MLQAQVVHALQGDQQEAYGAAAGVDLAQAVLQALLQQAGIAQPGQWVDQITLFEAGDVLGEQAVFDEQALQGVAQAISGKDPG